MKKDDLTVTPSTRYQQGVRNHQWQEDPAQRLVLNHLDRLYSDMTQPLPGDWLRGLRTYFSAKKKIRGIYLWGAVGRGKTFLVDLFYEAIPIKKKLRLHFHRFMGRIHRELKNLDACEDPLQKVAQQLATQTQLLCLDEFSVSDIGDAMILGRLLHHLFEANVVLVTTSNIPPHLLYHDGLQRTRFLPAIALLEQHCDVIHLESAQDYRLRSLTSATIYHFPLSSFAEQALLACFQKLAPGAWRTEATIKINHRFIPVKQRGDGIIWFEFADLCEGPRAVADYIEIAKTFNTVLLSNVPQFTYTLEDQARRFIHLLDEFYDQNVKLIISAAVPLTELYKGKKLQNEFCRTQSRLMEMQSIEYLAREHSGC